MTKIFLTGILIFFYLMGFTQDPGFESIHMQQQAFYKQWEGKPETFFDAINGFDHLQKSFADKSLLEKRVFGYHPYWGGSNYLNYHWDLISDLCYFSYEVDPYSGNPLTIHDWETSPAIDSALANNVKVHLCVTLFSGHASFFGSLSSQQVLIDNIISLIQTRGAQGVNMDVEALPSSQSSNFTNFMIDLCTQMDVAIPEAEVSIAAPAVNWSNKFNIPVLKDYIDFFMVMAYDYYWNGSGEAGPVSPLYSMTAYYDYNFSKTISYYQSQGVPDSMLIMGVPYYAYQWPTQGQYAPSSTTASGSAFTYANIKNNSSGHYSPENKHREPNSFAPYYSFQAGGWYQCFLDDVYSMGKKFDIVNRRGLGGIGIWALGYDNGYDDFWELINDKLTLGSGLISADTIFDTGGPAFDYYNDEEYTYTISTPETTEVYLSFSYLDLEAEYDSLWIFDGPDVQSPLLGKYSGDTIPTLIVASENNMTLKFKSDPGIVASGWRAVYDTMQVSGRREVQKLPGLIVYPNPAKDEIMLSLHYQPRNSKGIIFNDDGRIVKEFIVPAGKTSTVLDISNFKPGIYLITLPVNNQNLHGIKLIVK